LETVEDSVTNLSLANIKLDGLDNLFGNSGADSLVWEGDGGAYVGDVWVDDGDRSVRS
jgi:hypothetical protein